MKLLSKIGVDAIVCGIVFSAIGGTVFALNAKKFNDVYLGEPVSYEKNIDENITEIDIDISFMNIDIKQGDKFAVKAENIPEKLVPDISVSENQLLISDKDFSSRLKKKDFQLANINDEFVGTFTVYIPDKTLKKADINSAFSYLKIYGLNSEEIEMDCSFGQYILKDSECKKADFTSSFGSFEANNLKITQSANMDNSFGEMNINLSGDNYDINLLTSFGSGNSFECSSKDVKINASNSFGDLNFTK